MKLNFLIFLLCCNCSSSPGIHEYNNEDEQDLDCYNSYMGERGYCTK